MAGCVHEARYTAVEMNVLGGGGTPADRKRPEHRDSLTEEDTVHAAVHKRVSGFARPIAKGRHREAANEPDAQSVTLAG